MRVITGKARGIQLKTPQGMLTRPTADRVKEALFSIIRFDVANARVLDLFGGTGQMGIEALSRGAAHCTFLDLRKEAVGVIRENLKRTGFAKDAAVVQGDYLAFLTRCKEKFDLIFLDPPYAAGLLGPALEEIARFDICREHGIIVAESALETALPALAPPYTLYREYRYGKIKLTVYHRGGNEETI